MADAEKSNSFAGFSYFFILLPFSSFLIIYAIIYFLS
jgi:hypothetical protein